MIGERLLDLRKDAGLTQDELALILNINKHSISSYEREKANPRILSRLRLQNTLASPLIISLVSPIIRTPITPDIMSCAFPIISRRKPKTA